MKTPVTEGLRPCPIQTTKLFLNFGAFSPFGRRRPRQARSKGRYPSCCLLLAAAAAAAASLFSCCCCIYTKYRSRLNRAETRASKVCCSRDMLDFWSHEGKSSDTSRSNAASSCFRCVSFGSFCFPASYHRSVQALSFFPSVSKGQHRVLPGSKFVPHSRRRRCLRHHPQS